MNVYAREGMKLLCSYFLETNIWNMFENFRKKKTDFYLQKKGNVEREEELKNEILTLLNGDDVLEFEMQFIYSHLEYEFEYLKQEKHLNALYFLKQLHWRGIKLNSYTNDKGQWIKAANKMVTLLEEFPFSSELEISNRVKAISENAIKLKGYKYSPYLDYGRIYLSESDDKRFERGMRYRFEKIGWHGIEYVMQLLTCKYNSNIDRYVFRFQPSFGGISSFQIPLGYLYHVALTYAHKAPICKNSEIIFDEIVELSTLYFSIFEIQPLNTLEEVFKHGVSAIDNLQESIFYDQIFSIEQLSLGYLETILKGLSRHITKSQTTESRAVLVLLKKLKNKTSTEKIETFSAAELRELLKDANLSEQQTNDLLNRLSIDLRSVNKDYLCWHEIERRNTHRYPFLKTGEQYIFISRLLSSLGFYHVWYDLLVQTERENELGAAIELFIADEIRKKDISCYTSLKYEISKNCRDKFNSKRESGEMDIVIETPRSIFFIEVKKKSLTAKARSGFGAVSLRDIGHSLLSAIYQSSAHEFVLRDLGKICCQDGHTIKREGKRIYKIALTLFDFYGLHDGVFVRNFLSSSLQFNFYDKEEISNFNNILTRLKNIYSSDIYQEEYGNISPESFSNCLFLSIPQLLCILKNVDSAASFEKEILRTHYIVTGMKDWYVEYDYHSRMQSEVPQKETFAY